MPSSLRAYQAFCGGMWACLPTAASLPCPVGDGAQPMADPALISPPLQGEVSSEARRRGRNPPSRRRPPSFPAPRHKNDRERFAPCLLCFSRLFLFRFFLADHSANNSPCISANNAANNRAFHHSLRFIVHSLTGRSTGVPSQNSNAKCSDKRTA